MAVIQLPQRPWRRAAFFFSMAAFATFLTNLSLTIWASTRDESQVKNGVGVVIQQSCSVVRIVNAALHVLINIVGAILLAGSNYCMQCLIAPTRAQVDVAHEKRQWLDIGVPSFRNFFSATWTVKIMWLLLGLSSLPLHLLYNSTIVTSTSTNLYYIYALPEETLIDRNTIDAPDASSAAEGERLFELIYDGSLDPITLGEFFEQYGKTFQSARGTVAFVIANGSYAHNESTGFPTLSGWPPVFRTDAEAITAVNWICDRNQEEIDGSCSEILEALQEKPERWINPFQVPSSDIKAIYSQRTEERCKILFNPKVGWIVTGLNILKGILMLCTALRSSEDPLLTLGDAIDSFLQNSDPHTVSMCLKSRQNFRKGQVSWSRSPEIFRRRRTRQVQGIRRRRLIAALSIMLFALAIWTLALCIGYSLLSAHTSALDWGLGAIREESLINFMIGSGDQALLTNILLANSPQAVLSIIYVGYNSLFTNMCAASEWASYATHRKGLRVSTEAQGYQKETYFLQLPYRWSLPLIAMSGLVHWLISQSIFVVIIQSYTATEKDKFAMDSADLLSYVTCAWSPLGFILVIIGGSLMTVALFVTAFQRLSPSGMPMASSNSAAISAACHHDPAEKAAWEKLLKWGASPSHFVNGVGHCSFSSENVEQPLNGSLYA
ncbi:hypothetical protein HJFPF1_13386 [Paramyrothecium foliicola]|nr:hypothetical protein HJFPF1_13386 [Paramyrothecium foliicola]